MAEDKKLFLPVLQGTTRPKRRSIAVSRFIVSYIEKTYGDEIETQLVDPKEYAFPNDGKDPDVQDPRYTELTRRADGFVIVIPEYNHSFSGSLKRMLDSELTNYIHKPAALCGVSAGPWGGVRAIESILSPLREMGMIATFRDVNVAKVGEAFDDHGNPTDAFHMKPLQSAITELVWMAKVLSWGRENVPSKYHAKD